SVRRARGRRARARSADAASTRGSPGLSHRRAGTAARQGTVRPPPRRTGTSSRSIGLPGKESRRPLQNLALLTQQLVFTLELTQPLPLLPAQHVVALAPIGLVLPPPVTQRLLRAAQLRRELPGRPHPRSQHPHRLDPEPRRVRRSRPRHLPHLSRAAWPESIAVSTRPGQIPIPDSLRPLSNSRSTAAKAR